MSKYFIIPILALILSSCVQEAEMYPRQYLLKNNSGVNINIKIYDFLDDNLTEESLAFEDTLFGGRYEHSSRRSDDPNSKEPTGSFASDSIILIFNGTKKTAIFLDSANYDFSKPVSRNLFRHGNYKSIGNDQFIYTITPQDFENAKDCNGDCK